MGYPDVEMIKLSERIIYDVHQRWRAIFHTSNNHKKKKLKKRKKKKLLKNLWLNSSRHKSILKMNLINVKVAAEFLSTFITSLVSLHASNVTRWIFTLFVGEKG